MALETHDREYTGIEGGEREGNIRRAEGSVGRERKEGREMKRFILDGIDRLLVKGVGVLTVMRGLVDGKLQAISLGLCPWELLPGKLEPEDGEASESEGFLSGLGRFAKGPVGRILQSVGLGCASAAGVAACGVQTDAGGGNNQPFTADNPEGMDMENPEPQFGTAKLAMTEGDLLNLGEPQKVPWDEGDQRPNISQMDGKKIITFSRGMEYNNGQADETVWYVECDDIEKCIIEGKPQVVQGLQESYQEFTNHEYPDVIAGYGYSIIYKDMNGQYKLYAETGPELSGQVKFDIAHTGEGGGLKVSNLSVADPPLYPNSGLIIDGTPYSISYSDSTLLNLHTGEQQPIDLSNQCSAPHVDANGGWWVGSRWEKYGDKCKLFAAPTLEDLGKQLGDYMMIESQGVCNNLYNPRIFGEVIIWEGSGCSGGGGIFYALVQPYCGDGTPNGNETPQSCPKDFGIIPDPDTIQPEPQPDTATVLPDQDIAEETGEQIDAVVIPEDTTKPKPDTVPPIDTPHEDTAEPKPDTLSSADTPQDTVIPPKDTPHDAAKDTGNPKPDIGKDTSKPVDTPQDAESPYDTAQDVVNSKPDADTKTGKPDTVPSKDTVQPEKDTENPVPEPEEEESGGGSGGCSVTW